MSVTHSADFAFVLETVLYCTVKHQKQLSQCSLHLSLLAQLLQETQHLLDLLWLAARSAGLQAPKSAHWTC